MYENMKYYFENVGDTAFLLTAGLPENTPFDEYYEEAKESNQELRAWPDTVFKAVCEKDQGVILKTSLAILGLGYYIL